MPRELLFLCKVHIIRWLCTGRASMQTKIEKEKLERRAACMCVCVWVSCNVHLINFALGKWFFLLSRSLVPTGMDAFFSEKLHFSYVSSGLGPSQDYKLNGYFSFGACVRSFIFRKINFGQKALGYANAGPTSLSTFWTPANFDTMMRECWPRQFGVPFHFAAVKIQSTGRTLYRNTVPCST